jgi:DNA repair exonuclease SbcCD nuclease subunit
MLEFNPFKQKLGNYYNCTQSIQTTARFIHASDIHLGSHQYRNEYRANDFIQAFQEILELAIIHQIDFLLLGGDVFTSLEMLPGTLDKIISLLNNFYQYTNKTISIIAIEGNHDIRKFSKGVRFKQRGKSWLKLLANLGLIILLDANLEAPPTERFKPYNFKTRKGGKIQIKKVVIYGTRYLGEQPISYLPKIRKGIQNDDGLFHILIQHFGIEGQMKNVPGINIDHLEPLRHRINYLALGHFHKQFIIDEWIYNPGSPEAVCSVDTSFKRGIFLVEISGKEKFNKNVRMIRINNRNYLWQTIISKSYRNKFDYYKYIIQKLKQSLKALNRNIKPSNSMMPVLYLKLKGIKPSKSCNIKEKELKQIILEEFPVVDVKVYQKFTNCSKSLDKYL